VSAYCEFVHPLDYEFDIQRYNEYLVLGVIERKGTLWLYVVPLNDIYDINIVPAVLFYFDASISDMIIKMNDSYYSDIEIIPAVFSNIDNWLERYVEEDEEVTSIVRSEIDRLLLS
jgi:hypothetical protein